MDLGGSYCQIYWDSKVSDMYVGAHIFCGCVLVCGYLFWILIRFKHSRSICFSSFSSCSIYIYIFIFDSYGIQAGANINISAGGATPLHIAADNGSLDLISCLLKAGADPNVSDEVRQILSPNFILLAHKLLLAGITDQ